MNVVTVILTLLSCSLLQECLAKWEGNYGGVHVGKDNPEPNVEPKTCPTDDVCEADFHEGVSVEAEWRFITPNTMTDYLANRVDTYSDNGEDSKNVFGKVEITDARTGMIIPNYNVPPNTLICVKTSAFVARWDYGVKGVLAILLRGQGINYEIVTSFLVTKKEVIFNNNQ